jgi:hypothetical protein
MPRGDKSSYTNKQKRQAGLIEAGYKKHGVPEDEAERWAWATVNKRDGGGKKSGSGRSHSKTSTQQKKDGIRGGAASSSRSRTSRSSSTRKAALSRERHASP